MVIFGGGLGLYLLGLGVLGEMVLNQHDKAMQQRRTYLVTREPQALAERESSGALLSAQVRRVEGAPTERHGSAAGPVTCSMVP